MRRLVILWLLTLVLVACGGGGDESNQDNPAPAQNTSEAAIEATPVPDTPVPTDVSAGLAARVNGEPITLAELEEEMRIYEAGTGGVAADREALVATVLERLIEQKIIEQAAVQLGVEVTDTQIQEQLALQEADAQALGYSLDDFFTQQGITAEQYPERLRAMLITQAVNEQVIANVPTTTVEVHARHILVADEATARQILDELANGADFAALAEQYSLDPTSREAGGDLGWIAPGDLIQAELEAAIFALPANARNPEPVRSVLGYHIIESIERAEGQPLDPAQLAERYAQAWTAWRDQQLATATIERYVGPNAQ